VQYTAAAIVNDLASRAMPASVYSIPTSANAEDQVSMGANEARHVLAMADDLGKVLALELMTAAQALDLRVGMVEGEAHPGRAVAAAHAAIRERIAFLDRDRALDGDVATALRMVADGSVLAAARAAS
jgi:histidine ammonia-lyase